MRIDEFHNKKRTIELMDRVSREVLIGVMVESIRLAAYRSLRILNDIGAQNDAFVEVIRVCSIVESNDKSACLSARTKVGAAIGAMDLDGQVGSDQILSSLSYLLDVVLGSMDARDVVSALTECYSALFEVVAVTRHDLPKAIGREHIAKIEDESVELNGLIAEQSNLIGGALGDV